MKSIVKLIALAIAAVTIVACANKDQNTDLPDVEVKDYVERMVPVVDVQNTPQGMVTLRFYKDMPSVAYVSVSNFQSMIYPGTTVQVVKTGENLYGLTSPCGTATVDTANDIFESDDYEAFTNLMGMVQPGMPNTTYDATPMVRWKSLEATPRQVHVALDYGKYGIDLRADDTDVYFPFATIADLYTDVYNHTANFNGELVMVAPDGSYGLYDGYPAFFITPILKETRTTDMTDFAYRNLCFTLTNFFGYPGRSLLENKGLKEKGLDQALQDYGKAGQMTRELLLSTNRYDFMAGTVLLTYLLYDGGHTHTDVRIINDISGNPTFESTANELIAAKYDEFWDCCPEFEAIKNEDFGKWNLREVLSEARTQAFGEGVTYYKEGETAYCWFDDFFCDNSAWRKFYQGEGPKPTVEEYPDDCVAVLADALEKAEADPEVKNFVLDLSTNGGGSADAVAYVFSLLCNKADFHYENTLTGQKMNVSYDVDRNLDGKFDEKDADVTYHLNFAVLTSTFSFSGAHILPALLKENGIPLIGMKTDGGSCCVICNPSADGFGYIYSSHRARFTNTKGERIESGIEPTYPLETIEDFTDIPKLTQLIESYYRR